MDTSNLHRNYTQQSTRYNANGVKEISEANNQLSSTLKSLFAVAENYPELKANEKSIR